MPDQDWQALDERERAYDRVPAAHQITHPLSHRPEIAVYAIPEGQHATPTVKHALLLSYIDVVAQGYLAEFGVPGAARFFETTDGWDAPIIDDRAAPRYSRHCRLTAAETELVDDHLNELGAHILRP